MQQLHPFRLYWQGGKNITRHDVVNRSAANRFVRYLYSLTVGGLSGKKIRKVGVQTKVVLNVSASLMVEKQIVKSDVTSQTQDERQMKCLLYCESLEW